MRQFIVFVCLLNVAVGHVKIDNHDVGDSVTRGRDRFGGGVLISRDVIAQNPVDSRSIIDEINKLLVKAPHGISADEMRAFSKKLKHLLHAWIERKKLEVLDEEVTKFIKEITSSFSSVAALDLLNSDALGDEAYRVTVILQMLKRCKEEIQNALATGDKYGHIIKVVYVLADKLENAAENAVDLYKVNLYKRDVYKRDLSSRQGNWSKQFDSTLNSIGGKLIYDNGPLKAFGGTTYNFKGGEQYELGAKYSKGPLSFGGGVTVSHNSGINGGINFGYSKDNLKVGGGVQYNHKTGPIFGISGSWSFK